MQKATLKIAPGLELPATEACVQTIAMIAKRGAGKTFTALKLIEELLAAEQVVVVVDPVGVCWGLRSSADGKGPGFPVLVFGGSHGDLPLEAAAGEMLADLVVDERRSCVLDLSELRKGESVRFMIDFAERLYHRNREPLHVVLDEADAFAPQKPMTGTNEARMLGAVEDLVRRGRARGIGLTMTTQRAAVLNKNVLTQCEVLVTLKTISPQDRKAVEAWIEIHGTAEQRATMLASLAALPNGVAWWWSPWRDLFLQTKASARRTYDSSATPTGRQAAAPRKRAEVDLEALRGRLKEVAERAKASDPKLLQKRVAELQRELAAAQAAKPTVPAPQPIEVPVLKPADLKRLESALAVLDAQGHRFERAAAAVRSVQQELGAKLQLAQSTARIPPPSRPALPPPPVRAALARAPESGAQPRAGGVSGRSGLARMLTALAQRPEGLSSKQLGIRAGMSTRSGTWDTYLSRARVAGWLTGTSARLQITSAGLAELGDFTPLPTGQALLEHWINEVGSGSGAGRILRILAEVPGGLERDELARRAGLSTASGTWDTYLSRLRVLQLIEGGRGEPLRASEELFE